MNNKIDTIIWFLKRPQYLSQIFQILKRKKNEIFENTRDESTIWCKKNHVTQNEALKKLVNINDCQQLNNIFSNEMKEAHFKANNCHVKMGGEGAISFLYHLVKETKSNHIVETGVAYGWSSLAILLAIKDQENARLISNDMPYIKMNNDDYVGCVISDDLKSKWELQRLPDIKGIPLALSKFNNCIDFCHYDSDKSYTGRMWASPLLWNALKDGGYFVSDDINDNLAFKHFCEVVKRNPIIIEHSGKYVGIIVK